ncbi:hypothetical protein [Bradyrhizobium sp. NAS96.2]|uniref:hypothetical protein n=1 Tax=Bradyrhizobium sp. NAS96.2 TaxID=1680160 RepID=UPI001161536C|nr:hypothetical protein [Bradyrhizobium sp. NAS96.2]
MPAMMMGLLGVVGSGGGGGGIVAPFGLDGANFTNTSGATTTRFATLSTTYSSDLIFCLATINSAGMSSVTDTSGVTSTWTRVAQIGGGGSNTLELWVHSGIGAVVWGDHNRAFLGQRRLCHDRYFRYLRR